MKIAQVAHHWYKASTRSGVERKGAPACRTEYSAAGETFYWQYFLTPVCNSGHTKQRGSRKWAGPGTGPGPLIGLATPLAVTKFRGYE